MTDDLLGLAYPERESTLLLAIIEATAEGPGVEPLAAAVAKLIVAATETDVCFVHVLDDTGQALTLAGATPPFDTEVGRIHLPLGVGVAAQGRGAGQGRGGAPAAPAAKPAAAAGPRRPVQQQQAQPQPLNVRGATRLQRAGARTSLRE